MNTVLTTTLEIAYEEHGPANGTPVILMHGFPDDVHAYDGVASALAASGCRVIVPYLRGYGPTRFRDPATPRSGQQGAPGQDLLSLMDGLSLGRAVIAAMIGGVVPPALWRRCGQSELRGSYRSPGTTFRTSRLHCSPHPRMLNTNYWYQWYFHTERGRADLSANRRPFCRAHRGRTRETARDYGTDNRVARRKRWSLAAAVIGAARPLFYRPLPATGRARCWTPPPSRGT
jgi:pimeloyl-ACP methyl ester carboxylesterase